jgi:hypothetical protein
VCIENHILRQDGYSIGLPSTFGHSSIGRNGKRQSRCVLGRLHTTLQLLPVGGSGFVRYNTLHPSDAPTSESKKRLNRMSVEGTQHFLHFHFVITNRPGKVSNQHLLTSREQYWVWLPRHVDSNSPFPYELQA